MKDARGHLRRDRVAVLASMKSTLRKHGIHASSRKPIARSIRSAVQAQFRSAYNVWKFAFASCAGGPGRPPQEILNRITSGRIGKNATAHERVIAAQYGKLKAANNHLQILAGVQR